MYLTRRESAFGISRYFLLLLLALNTLCGCNPDVGIQRNSELSGSVNLGVLHPLASVRHEFIVRNNSGVPEAIGGIQSDCGCVVVSVVAKEIPAFSSIPVDVAVTAGSSAGPFRRRVTIETSNEKSGQLIRVLEITGEVREALQLSPACISESTLHRELTVKKVVSISNTSGARWDSISFHCSQDQVGVQIFEIEEPAFRPAEEHPQRWVAQLDFTLLEGQEYLHGSVFFSSESSSGSKAKAELPFEIRLAPRFEVTPSQLSFREHCLVRQVKRVIIKGAEFLGHQSRLRVECGTSMTGIKAGQPTWESGYWVFEVSTDPGFQAKQASNSLEIFSEHGTVPISVVPVFFYE